VWRQKKVVGVVGSFHSGSQQKAQLNLPEHSPAIIPWQAVKQFT
jgi:hypothetical protein